MNRVRIIGIVALFFVIMGLSNGAKAQFYQDAAGIRLGAGFGITGKTLYNERLILEGMLTTRWSGLNFTALAELTQPIYDTRGLAVYYGGGAHIGFWDYPKNEEGTQFFLGLDGIVGIEYTFENIPLNLSIDWKPMFNIVSDTHFVWDDYALSVRYVFNY